MHSKRRSIFFPRVPLRWTVWHLKVFHVPGHNCAILWFLISQELVKFVELLMTKKCERPKFALQNASNASLIPVRQILTQKWKPLPHFRRIEENTSTENRLRCLVGRALSRSSFCVEGADESMPLHTWGWPVLEKCVGARFIPAALVWLLGSDCFFPSLCFPLFKTLEAKMMGNQCKTNADLFCIFACWFIMFIHYSKHSLWGRGGFPPPAKGVRTSGFGGHPGLGFANPLPRWLIGLIIIIV